MSNFRSSENQSTEPSIYQEIISAEAYIRHSRAIRHLKSIRRLIIPLLIIAVFCCLVIITLYIAIFIADPNPLHDWDEYLSGKYIDITDSVKDCQVVSIPTDKLNTFDIHVIFIFPHRNFSGISHSIEDSNAEVVAVYENIDGIYNIFRFKHSDIHNAVASNDGDTDIGVLNREPFTTKSNPLVAIIIRFIQDLSLFFHSTSVLSGYFVFTMIVGLVVFVVVFVLFQIDRRIQVHQSCLSCLTPVDIYQTNETDSGGDANPDPPSEDSATPDRTPPNP